MCVRTTHQPNNHTPKPQSQTPNPKYTKIFYSYVLGANLTFAQTLHRVAWTTLHYITITSGQAQWVHSGQAQWGHSKGLTDRHVLRSNTSLYSKSVLMMMLMISFNSRKSLLITKVDLELIGCLFVTIPHLTVVHIVYLSCPMKQHLKM